MEQSGLEQFKADVHKILISKLDLEKLSHVNSVQARQAVANMINEIIGVQRVPLAWISRRRSSRTCSMRCSAWGL